MPLLIILALIAVWIALYILVLKIAFKIIDTVRKSDIKRFNCELDDYDLEKKMVTVKVTGFFITIPILFILFF